MGNGELEFKLHLDCCLLPFASHGCAQFMVLTLFSFSLFYLHLRFWYIPFTSFLLCKCAHAVDYKIDSPRKRSLDITSFSICVLHLTHPSHNCKEEKNIGVSFLVSPIRSCYLDWWLKSTVSTLWTLEFRYCCKSWIRIVMLRLDFQIAEPDELYLPYW